MTDIDIGGPCLYTSPAGVILSGGTIVAFDVGTALLQATDAGAYCAPTSADIICYDSQMALAGSTPVTVAGITAAGIATDYSIFYGIGHLSGTTFAIYEIDPITGAQTQVGTFLFADTPSLVSVCGVSPDGATLYLSGANSGTDIGTVSTTGTASAIVPLISESPDEISTGGRTSFVMRNGEILALWRVDGTSDVVTKRYAANGTLLHTYTQYTLDGLALFASEDDLSFCLRLEDQNSPFPGIFKKIRVSDGVELESFSDISGDYAVISPMAVIRVAIGASPPTLTFPDTPGEVGIAYSAALVASDGTPPYGPYAITVGALPNGLSLDAATGVISGIPTNVETANFTAQVTDDNSQTGDCLCSIDIGDNMALKSAGLIAPMLQFEDDDGVPYAGGSVAFYAVGTSNLLDVYSDDALFTPLPNPVPLNAAGRSSTSITGADTPVYFQQKTYDYSLFDADSVLVYGPITFSGSQWPGSIQGQSVMSPAANANAYANRFTTTINKAVSGTHALFAGTRFDIPTIGAAASTLTESATVYIEGPPATGTNPYALHVASGTVKFDGPVVFAGNGGSFGNYRPVTANTNAVAGDRIVVTANTPTITLPAASANLNAFVVVLNNGTGLVTISPDGSDKVGLATSQTLNVATATAQGDSLTLVSDGISNWNIV